MFGVVKGKEPESDRGVTTSSSREMDDPMFSIFAIQNPLDVIKKTKVLDFTIFYTHEESMKQTLEEVFERKIYDFDSEEESPFIIDAGAGIGLSLLFFKSRYPKAKVVCFEPDPKSFELLKMNVLVNELKNVELVNAALCNREGQSKFYGEIYAVSPDSRGNSIIKPWGKRIQSDKIFVNVTRLSNYVREPVDYLKLDIEGAEQEVLEDLFSTDTLKRIKRVFMEVHEVQKLEGINDIVKIRKILESGSFAFTEEPQEMEGVWPTELSLWVNKRTPKCFLIQGYNPAYIKRSRSFKKD